MISQLTPVPHADYYDSFIPKSVSQHIHTKRHEEFATFGQFIHSFTRKGKLEQGRRTGSNPL